MAAENWKACLDFVLTKAKVSEKVVPFAELIGQAA